MIYLDTLGTQPFDFGSSPTKGILADRPIGSDHSMTWDALGIRIFLHSCPYRSGSARTTRPLGYFAIREYATFGDLGHDHIHPVTKRKLGGFSGSRHMLELSLKLVRGCLTAMLRWFVPMFLPREPELWRVYRSLFHPWSRYFP